jgi:hypothetical protein
MANRSNLQIQKQLIQEYKQDLSYSKITQIYFFLLFGLSYFSDKIFFNNYLNSDRIFEDEKAENYIYISTKFNIIFSFSLILLVLAKEYARNFLLSRYGIDKNINVFYMTFFLIISKLVTLFLIYFFLSATESIFIIYSLGVLAIVMLLGMSVYLSLIQETIILVFSKNLSSIKEKLDIKDSYLNSLPNPIKLILSFLMKRTKERSF